jgi:RimJ/RimL family protein N-acetyltransferase
MTGQPLGATSSRCRPSGTDRTSAAPESGRARAAAVPTIGPMRWDQLAGGVSELRLEGESVRLEPMRTTDAAALLAAASEDRSSYGYTLVPATIEEAEAYVAEAVAARDAGRALPFTVVEQSSGRVVGTSRFLDLETFTWPPPWPAGVVRGPSLTDAVVPSVGELGSTWYAASAQGARVNPEAKLLMLGHAFEAWAMVRITLKTDARNARSRAAIEKLGARFEGIRRAHVPATDGSIRDSAYYSIVADEWPAVRAGLESRLGLAHPT